MRFTAYNSNGGTRGLVRRMALAAILTGAWAGAAAISLAATQPRAAARGSRQVQPGAAGANVAQNDEIRVLVTPGWSSATTNVDEIAEPLSKLGPHLLLNDGNYTLELAYHAAPPAVDADTRFSQIFTIPWLKGSQTGCSFYLRRKQQVINEKLILVSLWFNAADSGVAEACGVPAGAGARWFAAFITNATGGFFLRSTGAGCGEKAYILTTNAKTPRELPVADDDKLADILSQVGRIVASVQYKRCAVEAGAPLGIISVGH